MSANVYCTHCCLTYQDGSLLLWNHYYDSTHVEEELHYYYSMEPHGCNRHVGYTAVYAEVVVAALFLRYSCDYCEASNLDAVVDDVVADIDDVAAEADDVDMNLNGHMKKKTAEEGPSLPSHYFSEVHHTSVNVESLLWLLRNYGRGYDWSVMKLMPVSYCRLAKETVV